MLSLSKLKIVTMSKNSDHILLKEILRVKEQLTKVSTHLKNCNNNMSIIVNNLDIEENELDDLFLDEKIDIFGSIPALKSEFAANNLNELSSILLKLRKKLTTKKS